MSAAIIPFPVQFDHNGLHAWLYRRCLEIGDMTDWEHFRARRFDHPETIAEFDTIERHYGYPPHYSYPGVWVLA